MSAIAPPASSPRVLADLVPTWRWKTVALVAGGALLTALAAQVRIPLAFSPVPITGQTFAVLLCGATLGARRGAASQALYWLLGMAGLPFYTEASGGWDAATGATGGYLVGFIIAAAVVGHLAERGHDRRVLTAVLAMVAGTVVIYVLGAIWLAYAVDVPLYATGATDALDLGVTPFLLGDALKIGLAGGLTPLAWRLAR